MGPTFPETSEIRSCIIFLLSVASDIYDNIDKIQYFLAPDF